jgi:methylmalonyl-CoA mutase N-terminal domain/subunit
VADTIDPLAGSYFVESLTDEIVARATEYLDRIDKMGGAVKAVEAAYLQREIQNSAYRYQQDIEEKKRIIVGVNEFELAEEKPPEILKIGLSLEERQKEKLARLKARQDKQAVVAALKQVEEAARGTDNLMPCIIDAVRAYATLGEISDAMRKVFGEYRPAIVL